jgi:hypothetical protein
LGGAMETNQIKEDLHHIKEIMQRNQRSLVDNGLSYIINGIGLAIGIPLTILMGYNGLESWIPYVWLVFVPIMVLINILVTKKVEKKQTIKTFGSEVFKYLWAACGLSIMILFVLSFATSAVDLTSFYIGCSSILAIGYLLTGVINDLPFMKMLSLIWWLTAIVCGIWDRFGSINYMPFFFSFIILVLQLIPASIIFKKWKKAQNG